MKITIISYISLLFIKLTFLPNINLLTWVCIAIGLDFLSGYTKAVVLEQDRKSSAIRKTFPKLLQYLGAIALVIMLGNIAPANAPVMTYVNDAICILIIYIESISICENFIEMKPESLIVKYFFKPVLTVLTISIDKLPFNKNTDKIAMLFIAASVLLLHGCRTIKDSTTSSKLDSTWTSYAKDSVKVQGATVTNAFDMDKFMQLIQRQIADVVAKGGKVSDINMDSLLNKFKGGLKHDTVTVVDPKSKAELKYWFDEYGKLQLSCTAKDQTLEILVAQINRLQKEKDTNKTTVIVREPIWYTWLFMALAVLEFGFIITLFIVAKYSRWQ